MNKSSIFLFAAIVTYSGICFLLKQNLFLLPQVSVEKYLKHSSDLDAESKLAAGIKINLSTADQYQLELIPQLNSPLAQDILAAKSEITLNAQSLNDKNQFRALLNIKGIGPKKAVLFTDFLELQK